MMMDFLSHVVICEVIEDAFIMNSGYRGFSSVEVGVRAVGRARRVNNGMRGTRYDVYNKRS